MYWGVSGLHINPLHKNTKFVIGVLNIYHSSCTFDFLYYLVSSPVFKQQNEHFDHFSMYINNIQIVCHNVDIRLFTGNTNVFVRRKSIDIVISTLMLTLHWSCYVAGLMLISLHCCCTIFGDLSNTSTDVCVKKLIITFCHEFILVNYVKLECGPMPNVMAALPNIGGALCSMPQSFADAHY